jgi:hypothetical protein
MQKEAISALQEGLRTFIIAEILTLVVVLGIVVAGINKELGTFLIEWNVALAVLVADTIINLRTAIARGVEKYIYKSGIDSPLNLKALEKLK